jgi:acyl-CoA-dependent ceramide synthase
LVILWSEFNEFKTVGPYELNWETEQYKCDISHWISTALLASLQALNLFWLYYILRIAYRFVFFHVHEDDRSDNDDNEFAEEQRLDALAREVRQARDGKEKLEEDASPNTLVNNKSANGKASSTSVDTDSLTNRKSKRKA